MDEDIIISLLPTDEAETLLDVEPLHDTALVLGDEAAHRLLLVLPLFGSAARTIASLVATSSTTSPHPAAVHVHYSVPLSFDG